MRIRSENTLHSGRKYFPGAAKHVNGNQSHHRGGAASCEHLPIFSAHMCAQKRPKKIGLKFLFFAFFTGNSIHT